ncbi:Gpi16 subunit GPI transamidase component family protein [Babesia bovis T2Bo]|uniref:Membrane protein, putative n=1 Tax=Babesia bovis TaxID=5865 RepID=A7AP19_BABBO|nr:Gpi16 subunit GPI transamidase component family protein [Babesia bovis T2Bo]EDO08303.1 Gpi16 subunit GPI transamidase component family protein [Babesia bovis T2Bo]|eukprot:XP_001611871.1 membrane protein [Babesia bovis T2Bo]
MILFCIWFAITLVLRTCLSLHNDVVQEHLSVQPLLDGNFLLVLDVSIATKNYVRSQKDMYYPGVLMDVMAPDLAKLYFRTQVHNFECTQHMGDWHSTWGSTEFDIFNHGETLWATWPNELTPEETYDHFETLALNLWGITGSQFYVLASKNTYVFDIGRLLSIGNEVDNLSSLRSLAASYSEDVFCVDNLYKWRTMLPSLGQMGLLSLINDERVWARSGYKGVRSRMFMERDALKLELQFQLFVDRRNMKKGLWNLYKNKVIPGILPGASRSVVEFIVPEPLKQQFDGVNSMEFDFLDLNTHIQIGGTFEKLFNATENMPTWTPETGLTFRVSELESTVFPVQRRVQSSLSVVVNNRNNTEKHITFVQPLPYWLLPQISTLTLTINHVTEGSDHQAIHWCHGSNCFTPSAHGIESLSMLYDKSEYWIAFGFSLCIPPNSSVECRVDLQKNKLRFDEIEYSMHRGQLIPSGILIDKPGNPLGDPMDLSGRMHYTGPFFSHIVLPDNTMSFNVMAGAGVIVGLLYSVVFHVATSKQHLNDLTSIQHSS